MNMARILKVAAIFCFVLAGFGLIGLLVSGSNVGNAAENGGAQIGPFLMAALGAILLMISKKFNVKK